MALSVLSGKDGPRLCAGREKGFFHFFCCLGSPSTSVMQYESDPLEELTWRPDPIELHEKPAPYITLGKADRRLCVRPHHCRIPPRGAPGNTAKHLWEDSSPSGPWGSHPSNFTIEPRGGRSACAWPSRGWRGQLEQRTAVGPATAHPLPQSSSSRL